MANFTKESLELLRQRIDLVDVLSPYLDLKRSGSSYKALCPFHEEKTPSFTVQRGDTHYHCFGCNAHGDAIEFLMNHQKMSFLEAVESLSEKFGVVLETVNAPEDKSTPKTLLKDAIFKAVRFYHFYLLHTEDGHLALNYLYKRGIDLDYIKKFQIGLSSKDPYLLQKIARKQEINKKLLYETGLIKLTSDGKERDFFIDRIMIPITDSLGSYIGFSARKYKEETFGPKYINTPETYLFKKSKVLFGLSFCKRTIAKQRKAIVVEGQFDALRLIYSGFTNVVAGQGTAFGETHVKELKNLGVEHVFLAFDSDNAGKAAAVKVGDLFQKEAIEVSVVNLPIGSDPDSFLIEKGPSGWEEIIEKSENYLNFLVKENAKDININSPSGKTALVEKVIKIIKGWNHPLMIHESLRKLAMITKTPESMMGIDSLPPSSFFIKKSSSLKKESDVNFDEVLETDFLRWLYLKGKDNQKLIELSKMNIDVNHFKIIICKDMYQKYMQSYENKQSLDLLSFAEILDDKEQLFLTEMMKKRIDREKAEEKFLETIQRILDRNWLEERERIKLKIQNAMITEDEALLLAKKFDELKRNKPKVSID